MINEDVGDFFKSMIKKKVIPVHLFRCVDKDGRDCYFFIACSQSKVSSIAGGGSNLDLTTYGKILASGFGKDPSKEIKDWFIKNYEMDIEKIFN